MTNLKDIIDNINKVKTKYPNLCIDSIFLEQNDIIDKYYYKDDCLHELRSCSKILVSIAIGIAIDRNMLTLDTKVYPIIKDLVKITNKENIEKIKKWDIKTLLTHTTGYDKMLMSTKNIKDEKLDLDNLLSYILNVGIKNEVGVDFVYNNVEPFILSVIFQEKFGVKLSDFINENVFVKMGIKEYKWNDYGKYCPGCTGLYLKHSDFHKIGELLLNYGLYNNAQIVSKNWIIEMSSMQLETPSAYKPERLLPKIGIGYYTFISRDGFIFRDGSNGQYIIINREKNLLITIMATEKDMKYVTEVLRNII